MIRGLTLRTIFASDRLVGGIEQAIASATAMIGLIGLSRLMTIEDLGVLSGAFGIWLIMEMVQHAVTISPFVVSCPSPYSSPREFGAWLTWNTAFAIFICLLFIALGAGLIPIVPLLGQALLLAGPLTLVGMMYMFCRRAQYHLRQRKALLLQASLYSFTYLAAVGTVFWSGATVSPVLGMMILASTQGVPALIFTIVLLRHARPNWQAYGHIYKARGLIMKLTTAGVLWQLSYAAALLSLTVWATPAAVAVYSVTRTLVRPVTLLISTICDVDFSRASRALSQGGMTALRKSITDSARVLAVLTTPLILLVLAFPGFFLHLLYGERYAQATLELRLWALLFIPLTYVAVLDIALTVLRDVGFLIRAHAVGLATSLVLLGCSASLGQMSTATALACLIVARLISLPLLHLRYRQMTGSGETLLGEANANAR